MIGIISDIHGNFVALSAVLEQLDRLGAARAHKSSAFIWKMVLCGT